MEGKWKASLNGGYLMYLAIRPDSKITNEKLGGWQ